MGARTLHHLRSDRTALGLAPRLAVLALAASLGCGTGFTAGGPAGGAGGVGGTTAAGGTTATGGAGAGGADGGTGGGAAGGTATPCHPAGLVDSFSGSSLSALWDPYADPGIAVGVENDRLYFLPTSDLVGTHYAEATTVASFDLHDCSVWVEVVRAFPVATPGDTYIELWNGPNTFLEMGTWQGELGVSAALSAPLEVLYTMPYNPGAHRWWRLREEQGTVYFETAPEALTWTVQHHVPTPDFMSSVALVLAAGIWESATNPGRVEFDNVDLLP